MPTIEPLPRQIEQLAAEADDPTPIVMINLLRYRQRAEYPPASNASPCSGREAYQRYATEVMPLLAAVGAELVWRGEVKRIVIGPESERWDEVLLVRYPSRRAFLSMVTSPDYQRVAPHRTAALADSRLVLTHAV